MAAEPSPIVGERSGEALIDVENGAGVVGRGTPDPVFAPLLDDPRTALRPPREGADMAAYRLRLDAPLAAVRGPDIAFVEDERLQANGRSVPLRIYQAEAPARGTILFLHGGGFVMGSIETHDAICRMLARASGARVIAVDYALAPEHPYPAAREDCLAALEWAVSTHGAGARVGLCGDSAGGYVALAAAIEAGDAVAAVGLLYPVVDPTCGGASWAAFGAGHVLTREWMRWAWAAAMAEAGLARASLLQADFRRLPPCRIVVAGCDPLRDENEALGAALIRQGVATEVVRAPGMIHGYVSLPMLTDLAETTIAQMGLFLRQHIR